MKQLLLFLLLSISGTAFAQYPWYGYDLYDWLVEANHPQGCNPNYVTFLPDDSTWVNMYDFSVMTAYFGQAWNDQPGDDLLLETSFHRDNYEVRLILAGGGYSNTVPVNLSDWIQIDNVAWYHMFPGCVGGTANFEHFLFPMNFGDFGVGLFDDILGIEITFLPTPGYPDFAGAYIIVPPCGMVDLGPDTIVCPGETVDIDATTPNATYEWQDGSTDPVFTNAGAGKYWVEITLPSCSIVDTIDVYESDIPLDLGDDVVLCAEETLLLNASTPGGSYEWQDNSSQPTFTVSEPGTYWVRVALDDCLYGDTIEVDYYDPLHIELGNDTILCNGDYLALDASYPGATFLWHDNTTLPAYYVDEPGTYAVTITVNGCSANDMIIVDYFVMDPVDLGGDVQLCEGEVLLLDAFIPGATYLWQDNSTASGLNVTEPGTYWVQVTLNMCTTGDTVEIDYGAGFGIDLGPDASLCEGETLVLDATTQGGTYTWQDNSASATYTVSVPGEYSVVVEAGNCTATDTVLVVYGNGINLNLGADTLLCESQTVLLDATTTNATYLWQDNSTNATYPVTVPGTYYVQVQVDDCIARDTIIVSMANLAVDLGNDTTLCQGETLVLNAFSAGATYSWQDNSTDTTLLVVEAGTYEVTIHQNNCSATDAITVSYLALSAVLGNDTTLCAGETIVLDAQNPGATFLWQDNSTADTMLVDDAGSYWVDIRLNNCSISDTVLITYDALAPFSLGKDTTLCQGASLLLQANSPASMVQWHDNSSGNTFLATEPGTYWATANNGMCVVADSITISFVTAGSVDLGNDTTLCEGSVLALTADAPGATFLWNDNSTAASFTVSAPGTYWVEVSTGNCSIADTITVDFTVMSPVDLGNDTILCDGETLVIDATTDGATYAWNYNNITAPSITVTESGYYRVTVSVGHCSDTVGIFIYYPDLPDIDLGIDTSLCSGEALVLDVTSPGSTYSWQDGSTDAIYSITEPGEYSVAVSQSNCTVHDTILVTYLELASIQLGHDTTLCWGDTLHLVVHAPGSDYLWSDNSTAQQLDVAQPGLYWVQVSLASCSAGDSIHVAFSAPVSIDLGDDLNLCEGDIAMLDATTPGAVYSWQDNSTHATYTIEEAGIYWVHVHVDGCVGVDSVTALYTLLPEEILGKDTTLCQGDIMVLDVTYPGASYQWNDLSTAGTFIVETAGDFSVRLQVGDCTAEDTIHVQYATPPAFDLGKDTIICAGQHLLLDAGLTLPVEYRWQDNSTSATYIASETGLYWLRVSDQCTAVTDSISIVTEDCNCHIYVPNVFTPDGDGINDMVRPVADCAVTSFVMRIYDRFGGLLFETKDSDKGWDGTVDGKIAQVGVYVYILIYQFDGEKQHLVAGDLTVIR